MLLQVRWTHRSFRQTLTAIAATQPAIAGSLAKLLDQIVAGEDIRPPTTGELAAADAGDKQKRASAARKGLAWRHAGTCEADAVAGRDERFSSIFRLSKGGEAALMLFGLDASGKVSLLRISPDQEYE